VLRRGGAISDSASWNLADQIANEDFTGLDRLHVDNGVAPPKVVWRPDSRDLKHEQLRFLLAYWNGLSAGRSFVTADQIDPLDMWPALGFIMLVDVVDDGVDFRFRLYGSAIVQSVNMDVTGKLMSEVQLGGVVMDFFYAVYRAVLIRPEPLFTEHVPPEEIGVKFWHRLMLPLVGEDGKVCRVLVGNMPGEWRKPV
jgi:hypothetical protein